MTGYHETNFSLAYSSHISWQTPDSPVPVEVYPSLAWDNLFDNRGSLLNISILDRVKDRAEQLCRARSARPTRPSSTNTSPACAKWKSASKCMRKAKDDAEDAAKAQEHRRGHDGAPRQRPAGRSARARQADVRHHRHRLPDQQDARRVADHLARPFGDVLSVPGCEGRPPRRLAQQQFGWL